MANNVVKLEGTSCYLKDKEGNILVPKTNSGLVIFEDGDTLDEKIADIVNISSLSLLNEQISDLKQQVQRLNFDIGSTNNYYKLKALNNESSHLIDELNSIKNNINSFNEILAKMNIIEGTLATLNQDFNNLKFIVTNHNQTNEQIISEMQTKLTELETRIDNFPDGEITSIEKIEVKDETGLLVNSLLGITDNYESMCSSIDGFTNKTVKESVINAYLTLYKMEIKKLSDMPTHIQDLVSIRLMA